jgi:hypothetical protein
MQPEVRMARIIDAIGLYRADKLTCEEAAQLFGMSERHFRKPSWLEVRSSPDCRSSANVSSVPGVAVRPKSTLWLGSIHFEPREGRGLPDAPGRRNTAPLAVIQ